MARRITVTRKAWGELTPDEKIVVGDEIRFRSPMTLGNAAAGVRLIVTVVTLP
jgi:hypothetical protein